ncbi:MAG TPA: glycosyltransferase family 1 protein [Burkholderiaceae bacterium]
MNTDFHTFQPDAAWRDDARVEGQPPRIEDMRVAINAVAMLSPLTGIGQYAYNLVREMQDMRLSPWLFYGASWSRELRAMNLPGMEAAKTVFKHLVPRPYVVKRLLLQQTFSRGIKRHGVELYHEPNFMSYRFRGPTVVTVHDLSWLRFPETHPPERVREMNRIMPETLKSAAHILVDSEFVRREVINHYGVAENRISTTLLGVSTEFRPYAAEHCTTFLDRYRLQYGRYILAVATLEPRKNLVSLIAAFDQLPDTLKRRYPLVITGMRGWGESMMTDKLRQMIARDEVRLTGYVQQEDLPKLYSGARMFVYPSLYEGFGLPPLEAMACAVPVIASNRASLPEVVGNAGILCEPLDDMKIAQHMRTLIEDDALHGHLAKAGLQRSRQFTWRRCAMETLAIYRKALGER